MLLEASSGIYFIALNYVVKLYGWWLWINSWLLFLPEFFLPIDSCKAGIMNLSNPTLGSDSRTSYSSSNLSFKSSSSNQFANGIFSFFFSLINSLLLNKPELGSYRKFDFSTLRPLFLFFKVCAESGSPQFLDSPLLRAAEPGSSCSLYFADSGSLKYWLPIKLLP